MPNSKEAAVNLLKHGLNLSRGGDPLAQPCLDEPDDRPLGCEQESRLRITDRIGTRLFVLIVEPVELEDGTIAAKPISLRDATRAEERHNWRWHG